MTVKDFVSAEVGEGSFCVVNKNFPSTILQVFDWPVDVKEICFGKELETVEIQDTIFLYYLRSDSGYIREQELNGKKEFVLDKETALIFLTEKKMYKATKQILRYKDRRKRFGEILYGFVVILKKTSNGLRLASDHFLTEIKEL